jgi:hypothetical protein
MTRLQLEKSKKELLTIRGITEPMIIPLLQAGVVGAAGLLDADAQALAAGSGIPVQKIAEIQASVRRKKESSVIQI